MSAADTLLGILAEALGENLEALTALFCRLGGLLALLPGLSAQTIPVRIRLTLAVALTVLLLPLTEPLAYEPVSLLPLIAGEALQGLFLGFGVRVFVFALGVTGSVIAQALSLSQLFGVSGEGDSSAAVSNALSLAAVTLFLTADLDVVAIARFVEHLREVPLGTPVAAELGVLAERALELTAEAFAFGVMLALPFMVLNFAFYVLLGLLNRAMPQLMVTFVGLPAITLGGLFLLALSIWHLLEAWALRMGTVL